MTRHDWELLGEPFPLSRRKFLAAVPGLAATGAACQRVLPPLDTVFHVAIPTGIDSLDPHVSATSGAMTVLGNVYEPLVSTYAGYGLRPGLAQRWSSPDAKAWLFELRPGVRFHDGSELEANDVVFSLRRLKQQPRLDIRYYAGDIDEVVATGTHSVLITTRRRSLVLLSRLSHVFIVRAGANGVDERGGTGPYRIGAWHPGRHVVLQRFEGYWGERPSLARARIDLNAPVIDASARGASSHHEMVLLQQATTEAAWPRHALIRRGGLQVKYLGFDVGRETTPFCDVRPNPFRNPDVRRAVHLGLDRARLARELPGPGTPANQLVTREVFGYAPALPAAAYAPRESRRLLERAGFGRGLKTTLHTRAFLADVAHAAAEQLRDVGLEIEVVALPDTEYFAGRDSRSFTLWLSRWSCTTGDSAELFEATMHSPDPVRGLGGFNESGYRNPQLDRAIETAIEIETPEERLAALQGLMAQVMQDLPWVPLYGDLEVWALDRRFRWQPRVDHWLHLADLSPAR